MIKSKYILGLIMEHKKLQNQQLSKMIREFVLNLPKPIISSSIELRISAIEGNGMFAKRIILPEEILIVEQGLEVDGKIVEICEEAGFNTNLCIGWNKYLVHAPLNDVSTGYINHSCTPNIGLSNDCTMVAIKAINPGEEIVIDYGLFESDRNWTMKCNCGSTNCRHTITGRDFLLLRNDLKLNKYLSPYLKERVKGHPPCQLNPR